MDPKSLTVELPLEHRTPDSWAEQVLRHPLALLSDHAYLEKKAASNALELMNRWPEPVCPEGWVTTMASVARDEAAHLNSVIRLLSQGGGQLARLHKNPYANDLRRLVRKGTGVQELLDRLLVSALIEARSCERFEVLSRVCQDSELAQFYRSLWGSEFGHYRVFLQLGRDIAAEDTVERRWREMVQAEGRIIANQPVGPRLHSGFE
jgi:tRNA 2-(methylsulfanyl)-N6-isopentenyladenosine37 hydroxylase